MLRCGIETSAYLVPSTAQYLWNKLIQTMEGLEWDYVEPWSRKKVSLKLTLDKCAILTSEEKTYDSNGAAIRLLNEKESGFDYINLDTVIPTNLILERSGESFRSLIFSFMDQNGKEFCLRHDLTIASCIKYLNQKLYIHLYDSKILV